jgi:hypothetical protein
MVERSRRMRREERRRRGSCQSRRGETNIIRNVERMDAEQQTAD